MVLSVMRYIVLYCILIYNLFINYNIILQVLHPETLKRRLRTTMQLHSNTNIQLYSKPTSSNTNLAF